MVTEYIVFVGDDEERRRARMMVHDGGGQISGEFRGELEVAGDGELMARLAASGLSVVPLDQGGVGVIPEPMASLMSPGPSTSTRAKSERLRRFARAVRPDPQTGGLLNTDLLKGVVFGGEDPDVHGIPETDGLPAAPRSRDVYRVVLSGERAVRRARHLPGLLLERTNSTTLLMELTAEQAEVLAADALVRGVRPYGAGDTVESSTLDRLVEVMEQEELQVGVKAERPTVRFDITLHHDDEQVRGVIAATPDIDIVAGSGRYLRVRAPSGHPALAALANLKSVASLSEYSPPTLFADRVRHFAGLGDPNVQAIWRGEGETLAVFDTGIDRTHPDFEGRVEIVPRPGASADDRNGHGTHVAGIAVGDGMASDGVLAGIAPRARLVVVSVIDGAGRLDLPPDLGELLRLGVDAGARVCNLSLGYSHRKGKYDGATRSLDEFSKANPDVLVVVAAGNEGSAQEGISSLQNLSSPGAAKSALTVGASVSDRPTDRTWTRFKHGRFASPVGDMPISGEPEVPAALSSRGPTTADSVKPDVLATGTNVWAPRAAKAADKRFEPTPSEDLEGKYPRYAFLSGTSMAAPAVAAQALLAREFLRERMGVANPTAALVKALLIASAHPLPSGRSVAVAEAIGYPDFDQGFGRVCIGSILEPPQSPTVQRVAVVDVRDEDEHALLSLAPLDSPYRSSQKYVLTVPEGANGELVVVLAWTDAPGRSVQNDLRLEVRGPGLRAVGNERHTYLRPPALASLMARSDDRNTVEMVRVETARPGEYRVYVRAINTLFPNQGFALAALGPLGSPFEGPVT